MHGRPYTVHRRQCIGALAQYKLLDWLAMVLPCVRWMRTYDWRHFLLSDIIAGVSVGFMAVPQGMSYANLAGAHGSSRPSHCSISLPSLHPSHICPSPAVFCSQPETGSSPAV